MQAQALETRNTWRLELFLHYFKILGWPVRAIYAEMPERLISKTAVSSSLRNHPFSLPVKIG